MSDTVVAEQKRTATGHEQTQTGDVFGLIAEFDTPEALLAAAKQTHAAGYRNMDAFSSFPIEGLAEAIGAKKSKVPMFVLIGGLTGTATAFLLQTIARVYHYRFDIGARPQFAWPAFVPVMFELTILFAAFAALFSMIILNNLPLPYHSVFNSKNFERASTDGFFLCVEATDEKYHGDDTKAFLEGLGAREVSEVPV